MLFKLGLKNIKHNPIMNTLIILQMSVVFVILICMVSTVVSRFKKYKPFEEEFNSKGNFYQIMSAVNPQTNKTLGSAEEFGELIEGEWEVMSTYDLWIDYDGNYGDEYHISYDRPLLEKFTPELESGTWFDFDRPKDDTVQVVVSQNPYGLKVGDVVFIDIFMGDSPEPASLKAQVVGILKENATIVGLGDNKQGVNDYRNLYRSYRYEIEEKPLFLYSHEEIKEKMLVKQMNGLVLVTYHEDTADEVIAKNDKMIKKMMVINEVPLSDMKAGSFTYIFSQLYDLLPVFSCVLVLTLVGAVSTSALSAKRQLKNYAVYYICGLKWKQCAIVNFWSSFLCVMISFVIGLLATAAIVGTGMFGQTVISFGIWHLLGCLAIMGIYLMFSVSLPLRIIGNSSPKEVLITN